MTVPAKKKLVQKLVEVATEVRNIEKKGRNDAQGYAFAAEADVVRAVLPKLLEQGVLFMPVERRVVSVVPYQTKNGTQSFLTTHEAVWKFTDGEEELFVTTVGQGADTGDKGAYKAMTGDKKYALLQALGIATGDDPEATEVDAPSPKQLKRLFAQAKKVGLGDKESLQAFVLNRTGKHKSSDLTDEDFDLIFTEFDVAQAAGGVVTV